MDEPDATDGDFCPVCESLTCQPCNDCGDPKCLCMCEDEDECDDDFKCEACGPDIDVCQSPWGQLCVDCRDHEHCREVRDERENQEE